MSKRASETGEITAKIIGCVAVSRSTPKLLLRQTSPWKPPSSETYRLINNHRQGAAAAGRRVASCRKLLASLQGEQLIMRDAWTQNNKNHKQAPSLRFPESRRTGRRAASALINLSLSFLWVVSGSCRRLFACCTGVCLFACRARSSLCEGLCRAVYPAGPEPLGPIRGCKYFMRYDSAAQTLLNHRPLTVFSGYVPFGKVRNNEINKHSLPPVTAQLLWERRAARLLMRAAVRFLYFTKIK